MNFSFKNKITHRGGFTLIELLVVVAIISLLSSVVLASLNSARAKARDARRMSDLREFEKAIQLYADDHDGKYPLNVDPNLTWWVGTTPGCYGNSSGAVVAQGLVPYYISQLPQDPKPMGGNCYLYASDNGDNYKFLIYGTVETFNPQANNHPLRDQQGTCSPSGTGRNNSFAVNSPCGYW